MIDGRQFTVDSYTVSLSRRIGSSRGCSEDVLCGLGGQRAVSCQFLTARPSAR
jgi:hypothetical protein